ncbi:MAG: hypothetical protein HKUEN07_22210 [Rhodocyclaceae bacterium]|jgi:hypothetical protein|uniref:Glutaredoxin family protein n=1 Tax=Candidatus Desulfobacillus denitrificans TaxID=2608985 RepID=A0A809SBV2_9PROT|nr:glutaredoxin family protein [Candidatus Desulfobacillus denitrificans]GIK45175.1 MAG: hypothetical protein BroJett012_10780 [Betaproteobacteria bacterium]GJQ55652.1 MAG: hypothetical protein HKUEN07_22210 [Rhodocyclaceae bacterium]
MSLVRICLLAMLALSFSAGAQTLYKWVGKDGKVHYSDQPPPKEIRKVEEPRLRAGTIDTGGLPFETQQASKNFPVTLFTSADCKSECDHARAFLHQRGVPFSESIVGTPEQAEAYKKRFASVGLLLPALTVGSQKQQGFEAGAWNDMLDNAGYARTAIPGATSAPAPAAQ